MLRDPKISRLYAILDVLQEVRAVESVNKLIAQVSVCEATGLTPLTLFDVDTNSRQLIASAKSEVCMQFYKFFGGSDGGKNIIAGLRELHRRASLERPQKPIVVNILLNARGKAAQLVYKKNNETGLEELAKELNSEYFQLNLAYHPTAAFGTLHTKMILVDGQRGILRGGDPADPNNHDKHQFETATLVAGNAVACMRDDFRQSWTRFSNIKMVDDVKSHTEEKSSTRTSCIFISKKENGNPVSIKYRNCESPYKIALLQAINSATKSIKIMTPNLNDPEICAALAEACNRKIEIQIVMGKYHNDSAEARWGGKNFEAMAAIVKQVAAENRDKIRIHWATNPEGQLVKHGEKYTLHGKFACIDDRLVFVGTTPLDKQGIYHSREADIIFEDPAQAKIFTDTMFKEKFSAGKNYYEDCVDELAKEVRAQIKRLRAQPSPPARKKAMMLQNKLQEVLATIDHPDVEKHKRPEILLRNLLPILDKHTDEVDEETWRRTSSYKAVKAVAKAFGFDTSIPRGHNPRAELKSSALSSTRGSPIVIHSALGIPLPSSTAVAVPKPPADIAQQSHVDTSRSVTTSNREDPLASVVDAMAVSSAPSSGSDLAPDDLKDPSRQTELPKAPPTRS